MFNSFLTASCRLTLAFSILFVSDFVTLTLAEGGEGGYGVLELAEKNELFWNNINAIEIEHTFDQETPSKKKPGNRRQTLSGVWRFERLSNRERAIFEKVFNDDSNTKSDYYFDGQSSYTLSGNDLESILRLPSIIKQRFPGKVFDERPLF